MLSAIFSRQHSMTSKEGAVAEADVLSPVWLSAGFLHGEDRKVMEQTSKTLARVHRFCGG